MALGRALLCAAVALIATSANAVTSFTFVSGEVHITASAGITPIVDEIVALDGTFVDFETAPVGVPDFEISLAPSGAISMLTPYGGYDTFEILSAVLTPGAGYTSSGVFAGGTEYSVTMGPIDVDAVYSATDSGLVTPPSGPVPISFTNPSLTASIDAGLITFEMMGITLGVIGPFGGETSPLIVKGDITFVGVVPEPSTGLLVGTGLFGLAAQRKLRLRKSASHC
jgi:hypothetical protein